MNLTVVDKKGTKVKEVGVSQDVLDKKLSYQIVTDYVKAYQDRNHPKTASTKTKAEVSGSGAKPFRQKGTGRARQGCTRAPHFRGGGVVFGPRPRKSQLQVNKKAKQEALRVAFLERVKNERVTLVDSLELDSHKTKDMFSLLTGLNISKSTLILAEGGNANLVKACANLPKVKLMDWKDVNAYEVLKHKNILMSEKAYNDFMTKYFEVQA